MSDRISTARQKPIIRQESEPTPTMAEDNSKHSSSMSTNGNMQRSSTIPSSMSSDLPSPTDDPLSLLRQGVEMMKLKSKRRQYRRRFSVDEDGLSLTYESHKGALLKWWNRKDYNFSRIFIRNIVDIRDGSSGSRESSTRSSRRGDDGNSFTIVIGEDRKTITLAAPTPELKAAWMSGLQRLMEQIKSETNPANRELKRLYEKFSEADGNGNGLLDIDEVLRLLQSLSFPSITKNQVKELMKKQSANRDDFVALYRNLSRREEIEELFTKYAVSNSGDFIGVEELRAFFEREQSETIDVAEAQALIAASEPAPEFKDRGMLTSLGFSVMMATHKMNILKPQCRTVYQDMTQPMSDYFVNSSHNTYLEGHQIIGTSSVVQYERVLAQRCRCVELDVWDGDHGEPIITHGHTMVTKINYRDVLVSVSANAFLGTEYPVILSIENHTSVDQQMRMAKYLHEIFGSRLFVEPLDENSDALPSPERLKNKIIIKGKKLPKGVAEQDGNVSDEDEAAAIDYDPAQDKAKKKGPSSEKKKAHLAQELSDCVVICQSASFKSFETSASKLTFAHISSFEEEKAMKLAKEEPVQYVRHNAWQMSRTYPAGLRTNSSNYDPVPLWNVGCQVVALNFQTSDEASMLNFGRFQDNGGCGYVLKPEFMRSRDSTFDPNAPFPKKFTCVLKVRVISGYILPKKPGDRTSSILDPYVKVQVHGVPADCHEHRTETIENNGFNPRWNHEMSFTVTCPELALVSFRVIDEETTNSDVTVAYYCLPFECMQKGYRMIALRDLKGNVVGDTSLFVHIAIKQPTKNRKRLPLLVNQVTCSGLPWHFFHEQCLRQQRRGKGDLSVRLQLS